MGKFGCRWHKLCALIHEQPQRHQPSILHVFTESPVSIHRPVCLLFRRFLCRPARGGFPQPARGRAPRRVVALDGHERHRQGHHGGSRGLRGRGDRLGDDFRHGRCLHAMGGSYRKLTHRRPARVHRSVVEIGAPCRRRGQASGDRCRHPQLPRLHQHRRPVGHAGDGDAADFLLTHRGGGGANL